MATFYEIDSSRVTLREYAWGTPWILLPLIFLIKLLRIRLPSSSDDPPVASIGPFQIAEESLPAEVRAKFQPLAEELFTFGFHSPTYFCIQDDRHATRMFWANYQHTQGQTIARIHNRNWSGLKPPKEFFFPVFLSGFTDGTFLVSTSGKADLLAPTSVHMNRLVGATTGALWDSHRRELSEELFRKSVILVRSPVEVLELSEQHHVAIRDFHLQRGVFKGTAPTEETFVMTETGTEVSAAGMPNADVLVEIDRLQKRRTSWVSTLFVFVVSLSVFIIVGFKDNSLGFLATLVGVLFFHECGHYLAMKVFKYRNVKMFFIPFLGAAVYGRHYNVPGWKKAIVSLMGPLPGIVLGFVLGMIAILTQQHSLLPASIILLALNGIQLLPMLPLDGGQIVHTTLFCRHPLLDVGFRLFAALGLLGIGFFIRGHITIYFGIAILIGLPIVYRTAKIVNKLRNQGISPLSNDSQTIPLETAQLIIGEIRTSMPTGMNTRMTAQHTVNIFEMLNARPPHWLVTLLLLGVQGVSFLLAIVCAAAFGVVAHRGDVRNLPLAQAPPLKHECPCEETPSWQGPNVPPGATDDRTTVVATFSRRGNAEAALRESTAQLPPTATASLLGNTLLLTFPGDSKDATQQWIAKWSTKAESAYLSTRENPVVLSLSCKAPSDKSAEEIEQQAQVCFRAVPEMYLVPPWSLADSRAPADRAQHDLARHTFLRADQMNLAAYDDPEYVASTKRLTASMLQHDNDTAKKLIESQQQMLKATRQKYFEKLRQEKSTPLDLEVIDGYERAMAKDMRNFDDDGPDPRWIALGGKLGQLPLDGDHPVAAETRFSIRSGSVARNGTVLRFDFLTFEQLHHGAPAFVDWLCGQLCTDLKYEFDAAMEEEEE